MERGSALAPGGWKWVRGRRGEVGKGHPRQLLPALHLTSLDWLRAYEDKLWAKRAIRVNLQFFGLNATFFQNYVGFHAGT